MSRPATIIVAVLATVGVALTVGGRAGYAKLRGPVTAIGRSMPSRPVLPQAAIRDSDIAFYERRARRDPTGAMDLARAAQLYLQRARETGRYDDVLRAEADARQSLRNRDVHNASASQVLASALVSEHRFAEALEVQRGLSESDPTQLSFRAALGEIASASARSRGTVALLWESYAPSHRPSFFARSTSARPAGWPSWRRASSGPG